MICKNCGSQIADSSAFCVNCGATVEAQPQQQPQYAAPQYQQPQYAPQPQYYVPQPQYVYQPPVSRDYTEYIDDANSVMSRSIKGLVFTLVFPIVGWIIGFILALSTKGTIGRMRRREVPEEELFTDQMREDYATAQKKVKSARIISTINLLLYALPLIIIVGYLLVCVVVGVGVGITSY